ncbi:hypothetical protein IW261DRAFT_804530 [Armillaria novae-zelandiae]|uniref:Uncharacterized protein n=1 Tax=Armillaria novae-zelandiae TaxID=153914 RepID=A0AA39PLU7_9AGAR|nr:hypothetical protein IW261DRAFT_804530 [Armillaria novae-zelandiae]
MEVLIPSYLTDSESQTPNVTVILKSPGSDHQVVLPGLAPDSRGYVHIQVECVFNVPPSIDDAPCQTMEPVSRGFSFSGMFSWATEGLKNRLHATPPARDGKPSEPCTTTPQSQCIGPHGGPVIYANNDTGFLSSSPPPVRELPPRPPPVTARRSPPSIKDAASAVSLSSWAAANSIPFIYRDGAVFVPRHDDPSVEGPRTPPRARKHLASSTSPSHAGKNHAGVCCADYQCDGWSLATRPNLAARMMMLQTTSHRYQYQCLHCHNRYLQSFLSNLLLLCPTRLLHNHNQYQQSFPSNLPALLPDPAPAPAVRGSIVPLDATERR